MASEEFTFPIADPAHSPIDSPPLWCLSPAASPQKKGYNSDDHLQFPGNHRSSQKGTHLDMINPRKSCSFIERSLLKRLKMVKGDNFDHHNYNDYSEDYEEEQDEDNQREKMDLLWEDLNDELSKNRHKNSIMMNHDQSYRGTHVHGKDLIGCVPTSLNKFSKASVINGRSNISSSKNNEVVIKSNNRNNKKPSMIVLMKVFKKLFLLHHSQQSAKKRSC